MSISANTERGTRSVSDRRKRVGEGFRQLKKKARTPLTEVPIAVRERMIFSFLEYLDHPRALTVYLLYKSGEHGQLVSLVCDPQLYRSVSDFRAAYAATKFFSKCVGLKTGIDLSAVAIASAQQAESDCEITNQFFRDVREGRVTCLFEPELFRAKQIIADILGDCPSSFRLPETAVDSAWEYEKELEEFPIVGWSHGRTSASSGVKLSPYYKYGSRLDVSRSALKYALRQVNDSHQWAAAAIQADGPCCVLERAFNIVDENVMLLVPKSAKTDRVICYEPHLNIKLQLSVGAYLRSRLSKRGINLDDQSVNQRRAKLGSKTAHLATIDLKSASDTIAFGLVLELLPIDWVCLLDDLRSKYTLWPDGSRVENQKFSSMGNGFTFELESLLFYAICSAVTPNVSVYGDDLILPSASYGRCVRLLQACGFTVNTTKSFAEGYFRESCGGDYYNGSDCTPLYLRRLPKTIEDVLKFHNAFRAFSQRFGLPCRRSERIRDTWRRMTPFLHGPQGYGDGHYHVDFDVACPHRAPHGIDGWWFDTWSVKFLVSMVTDWESSCFPARSAPAAFAAALGPKKLRSIYGSTLDRSQGTYKKNRVMANFCWPSTVWV